MPAMKDVIHLEPSISGCDIPTCGITTYLIGIQEGVALLAIPSSICVIGVIYFRRMIYLTAQNMSHTQ
uniref:Uncharacterized protein n=1 Tax=Acrobeloides nanus TaxID=290746 RepID=A0A914DZ48_9BILA